jgi:SagB-type dehydrogenase family enzyme
MRRVRRSAHVVSFWDGDRAVFVNYARGVRAPASSLTWQLLDWCHVPRTLPEIVAAIGGGASRSVTRLVNALVDMGLLVDCSAPDDPRDAAMARWSSWNPSAGLFHTVSRQVKYTEQPEYDRQLRAKATRQRMPASVKPRRAASIALPAAGDTSALAPIAAARRTYRQFGRAKVSGAAFAELLRITSGVFGWLTVPGLGDVPLTTSPSAGARHPIETYVIVLAVDGIDRGIYHYAPDRHALDVIATRADRGLVRRFLPAQPWMAECGAIVFFSAVFARTRWRYEFARAYRAVLLEAGHVCQTLLLTATSLDLASFATMAIDERAVERALEIDGIDESVLYAAGVGSKPDVDARVIMPRGDRKARWRSHQP